MKQRKSVITMHPDSSKQDWKWIENHGGQTMNTLWKTFIPSCCASCNYCQLRKRFPESAENMPEVSVSLTRQAIAEALSETHSELAASWKGDMLQHVSFTQLYQCLPPDEVK